MRYIFLILFLVSFGSVSMGKWGDVYYCEMTNLVNIKNHNHEKFLNQKFKFRWEKSNIVMKSDGYFNNTMYLDLDNPLSEIFSGKDETGSSIVNFKDGNLYFSQTTPSNVTSVSAKCDKF